MAEFSRKHLNKSPTQKMMYQIKKNLQSNPFTKKVSTKLSKSTLKFIDMCQNGNGNSNSLQKYSQSDIDTIKRELNKFDVPVKDIETQLEELERTKDSLGLMKFDWQAGQETYKNELVLFCAKSKSGKSYTVNSLILEMPQSFDSITVFTGKPSFENIATQSLKKACESAGIHFFWINTDNKESVDFCDPDTSYDDYEKFKMDDGSYSKIYHNSFGAVHIYDDLYNKEKEHWVVHLMDDIAIFGRHRKINAFILFQGFTRISSKILDNATKIFIYNEYLDREDIWPKLKIDEPINLKEVQAEEEKARFYYLDDGMLMPYYNYDYPSKNAIINKLKAKTPIGLTKRKEAYQEKKKRLDELRKKEEEEKKKIEEDKRKYQERDEKDTPKEQKRIVANYSDPVGSGIKPTNNPLAKSNNNPKYTNPLRVSHFQRI